jgi:hypothetical protein
MGWQERGVPIPPHAHLGCCKALRALRAHEPEQRRANTDDRTIAKCCRFACAWGEYGGIVVVNIFAYRCTDQKRLIGEVSDLIGPDNDRHIIEEAKKAAIVVFAYGKPQRKALRPRGKELARLLIEKAHVNPHILSLGKDETPKHPLYLKKTLKPVEWNL